MFWTHWLLALLTSTAFAKDRDWLPLYLKQKSIKCELSQDQLKSQAIKLGDVNLRQIEQSLTERGIKFQLDPQSNQLETFPAVALTDIYAREAVYVYMLNGDQPQKQYPLQIQTTFFWDGKTSQSENALWFPLHIKNPKSDKPCVLERQTMSGEEQEKWPVVNLMFGVNLVSARVAEVIDIEDRESGVEAPEPPQVPPAATAEKVEEKKKVTASKDEDREDERDRRHRRDRESERRRERRLRRARAEERETSRQREPPPKFDECSAENKSGWKAVTCAVGIK